MAKNGFTANPTKIYVLLLFTCYCKYNEDVTLTLLCCSLHPSLFDMLPLYS